MLLIATAIFALNAIEYNEFYGIKMVSTGMALWCLSVIIGNTPKMKELK